MDTRWVKVLYDLGQKVELLLQMYILLAQTSEKSSHFTQDTGVKYFCVVKATCSSSIHAHVPVTHLQTFTLCFLLIYGKGQTGGSSLKRRVGEKEKTTILRKKKKNRTKIWCGKVNYNQLVIVMLFKWSFCNKPGKHCAIRNWVHVKSEHLQAEYALELTSFVASYSLFC